MSETASFRRMHPIAQQLVGKLFEAIAQEVEDLVAMDRSKMSLVERGRWSSQVIRLMKTLQKDYPEASETTKDGRLAIHRLKTAEELEAEEAEFDAILGLPPRAPKPEPISTCQPVSDSAPRQPSTGTPSPQKTPEPARMAQPSLLPDNDSGSRIIDRDPEIAKILRRIRPPTTVSNP